LVEEKETQEEVKSTDVMSTKERVFLSLADFSTILMVIVDLLYFGGLFEIDGTVFMVLNVVVVGVSFVGYQLKKRIRKRVEREKIERKSGEL
jgi:hypothetical protein